ncbi:dehydrogenase/reductase SDR family member on chromosome X-like isoform X2 [Varroa jacobsoni]|uniref:dehydrogenase/reductase SDR family member on chromosome X-like isoform X2 n=1 Tax=Varroa jacobsoni TaxID=62625 RepID=UPI000BF63A0D|nr:dehydrogenase/reductase SDR family member on chromosome X-like isoform X2 [Varroa jacobsoni]
MRTISQYLCRHICRKEEHHHRKKGHEKKAKPTVSTCWYDLCGIRCSIASGPDCANHKTKDLSQIFSYCNGQPTKKFNYVRQEQKVFIVTGGMGGIGRKVVERLLSLGSFVIITGRRSEKDLSLRQSFEDISKISSRYQYFKVDLESMTDTVRFCEEVNVSFSRLDGIVCNAGTLGGSYRLTSEHFESQQAVNYLSPIVIIDRLKAKLKSTKQGRVVLVTSAVHYVNFCNLDDFMFNEGYCPYLGYVQSKLALVSYARHVGPSLFQKYGFTVNAVHPGIVNTGLYGSLLIKTIGRITFISPMTASETILFPLLSTTMENVTCQYMENCQVVPPAKKTMDSKFNRQLYELTRHLLAPWLLVDQ